VDATKEILANELRAIGIVAAEESLKKMSFSASRSVGRASGRDQF
jgi:hypothetical protein